MLYFGYKGHWNAPLSLIEALKVPEILKPYVTDVKVNLFGIAYLTREQVQLFRSDFRVVADYFVQMRENGDYKPGDDVVEHVESILHLLNVMDKDHRFETMLNDGKQEKEVKTMSESWQNNCQESGILIELQSFWEQNVDRGSAVE